jgi:hypothetical protein
MDITRTTPPPAPPHGSPPGGRAGSAPDAEPDRSRAGAIWVTAMGAVLVFAAAAVFVTVQWDHIPDAMKLAALGLVCAGCLLSGRALRRPLPATSSVLYHLGAFLIPVVVAALGVHARLSWSWMLLVEGAVATVAFWWLGRVERSPVLDAASTASVVLLAAGVGATTVVPVPLALVAAAGVAELRGARRRAIAWALVAGLAPLAAAALSTLHLGPGVLVELGLVGETSRLVAVLVGVVSAAILGREATHRRHLGLLVAAGACAAVGVLDGWTASVHQFELHLIGAAVLFAAVELAALSFGDDPFWGGPLHLVGDFVEVVVAAATAMAVAAVANDRIRSWVARTAWSTRAPLAQVGPWLVHPAALVAGAVAVGAWLLADLRRREADRMPMGLALLTGAGWAPATVMLALTPVVAVAAGITPLAATGATAVVAAAFLVLSGRDGADVTALVLTVLAPFTALHDPFVAAALGAGGSLVLAALTVVHAQLARDSREREDTWLLAAATLLPVATALVAGAPSAGLLPAMVTAALVLWADGLVLDIGDRGPGLADLGIIPRAASLLTLLALPALSPTGICALTGLLAALHAIDGLTARRPSSSITAGALVPIAVASGVVALGGSRPVAALVTMGVAVLAALVDGFVDSTWSTALRVCVGSAIAVALLAGGADRPTLATLMIVSGGLGAAYAVRVGEPDLGILGGLLATGGVWLHLVDHHVQSSEPYLLPVTALMVVAGWQARRRSPLSSWVAYGPAVALLGGSALLERIDGGGAGHALVAGAVGLVAVVVGGKRRQAATLFLGTALLIGVTLHETVAVTAGVPTWGWLGLGGTTLIAAGILMERAERGPIETGRRLVDVIGERFS